MAQCVIYSIKSIEDIPNKDSIKLVTFNEVTYKSIVNIDTDPYNVGDKVLFIYYDSLIPKNERTVKLSCYEMLEKKYFNNRLGQIRTKVARFKVNETSRVSSWGLTENVKNLGIEVNVGDELDSYLGVTKFEEELLEASPDKTQLPKTWQSKLKSWMFKHFPTIAKWIYGVNLRLQYPFPEHLIGKSDASPWQKVPVMIEMHKDQPCVVTIKMEGQSGTYVFDKGNFLICSRNHAYDYETYRKKNPEVSGHSTSNYFQIAEQYKLKEAIEKYRELTGHDIAIQGELCGGNIQKNIYGFPTLRYFIYLIKDITEDRELTVDEMLQVIEVLNKSGFELEHVPIVARYNKLSEFLTSETGDQLIDWFENHNYFTKATKDTDWTYSYGEGKANGKTKFLNEGMVVRCGNDFIVKVKSGLYKIGFDKLND